MLLPQRIQSGVRACMAMHTANKKAARRRQGEKSLSGLFGAVLGKGGVDIFLQSGKVFFLVNAAQQGLAHNVAVPVKNVGGGEGHDVQRELAGLTAGGKVDVAVACTRCLQQFFGGINALLVAVQRLGVDADNLAALCLDLLVCLLYTSPSPRDPM